MSTLTVSNAIGDAVIAACAAQVRRPDGFGTGDTRTLSWTPDLTAAEAATVDEIIRSASMQSPMTAGAYEAVRSQMQTLRALRQMGRNSFMALSQTERDRLIYDNLVAATQVFLSILRDTP